MANYYLSTPKLVKQTGMTCWAAALESWLASTPTSPVAWYMKQEKQIVEEIRSWSKLEEGLGNKPLIHPNGGLTKEGAIWVLDNAGMQGKGFTNPKLIAGSFLESKLKSFGHLYIIRIWSGGMSHGVVGYGIEDAATPSKCKIAVMDPRPTFGLTMLDLSELQSDLNAFVGWLKPS